MGFFHVSVAHGRKAAVRGKRGEICKRVATGMIDLTVWAINSGKTGKKW